MKIFIIALNKWEIQQAVLTEARHFLGGIGMSKTNEEKRVK